MLWGHEALHGDGKGVELRQVVAEIVELVGKPSISDLFPALARLDLQWIESKMKKLVLWFDTIFESVITDPKKADKSKSKDNKDFLQFLLELMQQGDDRSSFSMTELKALFMVQIIFSEEVELCSLSRKRASKDQS